MSAFVLFMCSHEYYCETQKRKFYVQTQQTLLNLSRARKRRISTLLKRVSAISNAYSIKNRNEIKPKNS